MITHLRIGPQGIHVKRQLEAGGEFEVSKLNKFELKKVLEELKDQRPDVSDDVGSPVFMLVRDDYILIEIEKP